MTTERRLGPDVVRGALLSLVIYGHTLQESVNHSHLKWMIYAFHMPLFFALTGSLLTRDKFRRRPFPELMKYYFKRMGWQWLVASFIFALYRHVNYKSINELVIDVFLDPYFHLWFIPALFCMAVMTWTLIRIGASDFVLLVIGLAAWFIVEVIDIRVNHIDLRFASMYIWFAIGMVVSNRRAISPVLSISVAILGAAGMFVVFPDDGLLKDINFFMLNLGLALLLPSLIQFAQGLNALHMLAPIGQYSLWIYLLHPLVTDSLRKSEGFVPWWGGITLTAGLIASALTAIKFVRFVQK